MHIPVRKSYVKSLDVMYHYLFLRDQWSKQATLGYRVSFHSSAPPWMIWLMTTGSPKLTLSKRPTSHVKVVRSPLMDKFLTLFILPLSMLPDN